MVNSATLTVSKSYSGQACGSARVCGRRQLVVARRRWAIRTGARQDAWGLSVYRYLHDERVGGLACWCGAEKVGWTDTVVLSVRELQRAVWRGHVWNGRGGVN
jgi:hypothetical protein